jgi:pimeloyl-ACP methyl ester carboxylesterase
VGDPVDTTEGLGLFTFASTHDAGGRAVVYMPPGHDRRKPSALLVGLHPWNSDIWSYAAFSELLAEARARDVVLLMPSGLGNSLYTANAEDEVLEAVDAFARAIAVDARRVSIWGASMGGAGATTIGFHHPDRFATITSFFGDSKYDLTTYVKGILHDEAHAHLVNALDVVDNARSVPVWLIHGEEDVVSPVAQSEMLAKALAARRFGVRYERVPHAGHEGALVARFAAELVDRASEARTPDAPARVTYTSVRPADTTVYAIRFARVGAADATIDLERRADGVHVVRASGVRSVTLPRGALGVPPSQTPPVVIDDPDARAVSIGWDPVPSERDAR